jgi:hypothetical protein
MHRITSHLVGLTLATLILSGCAAESLTGIDGPKPATDATRNQPATAAPASTAPVSTAVAEEQELSEDEAKAFDEIARTQEGPGIAVGVIEELFPDDFAYAFFDETTAIRVAFKSGVPAEAVALLEATDQAYLTVEGVGFNAVEYQAAMDSVSEQTLKYATKDRAVTVSQHPSLAQGAILVAFHAEDKTLTSAPGLAESLTVDDRFRIIFDFTDTAPISGFEVFE